jgi:hypothetical protein
MKKGGGGFGFVMAIVVLLIVMLLSAKAWNAVMPTAAQALAPAPTTQKGALRQVDDHGQTEVGKEIRSGTLPDLNKMLESTNQHIDQVKDGARKQD